jgi:hypothetical protein
VHSPPLVVDPLETFTLFSTLINHIRGGDRYWPLFAAVVAIFMVVSRQAIYGFVQHDDYDYLIAPAEMQSFATPWYKTLSDGRSINWVWSLFSPNLTPVWSSVLFIVIYSTACWLASGILTNHRTSVLTALTLLFSAIFATQTLWPTMMVPSAILTTAALATFSMNRSFWFDLSVLAVSLYFGILGIPTMRDGFGDCLCG